MVYLGEEAVVAGAAEAAGPSTYHSPHRRRQLQSATKHRPHEDHPYLVGNYAPVHDELPLTPCRWSGHIPRELWNGQYVRNGGNPLADADEKRDAHWFDGDGMLTGVLFRDMGDGSVRPEFINRYILTDVLLSTGVDFRRPLLPSISLFSSPYATHARVLLAIVRTALLSFISWLPFANRHPEQRLRRIAVANTSVWWHDGRAFAGCESGPPMRVLLPGLETAGWWAGNGPGKTWDKRGGLAGLFDEMTTAHPRIDPGTGELLLYHMSFLAPFLRVSVVPPVGSKAPAVWGEAVPGLAQPKMAHDFGATATRTIMIDLPLSLDPRNWMHARPIVHFDHTAPTRFGVFPRRQPGRVRWYESPDACCVFHTANAWDEDGEEGPAANLLACRLNSATLVYHAGNVLAPPHAAPPRGARDKCQLYYWRFADPPGATPSFKREKPATSHASHEFALSEIPFEFPTMNSSRSLRRNRYVYGASMRRGNFDAGLGSAKIDCVAKVDVRRLVRRGRKLWDEGRLEVGEAVDKRCVADILEEDDVNRFLGGQRAYRDATGAPVRSEADDDSEDGLEDPIRIFALPPGCYAQEATFVERRGAKREDDGWLVFFVFDESTGLGAHGEARPEARSELWIVDALDMRTLVGRIHLPQRVPYGLHGRFFTAQEIASQRPLRDEEVRTWALASAGVEGPGLWPGGAAKAVGTRMGATDNADHGSASASAASWLHSAARSLQTMLRAQLG